MKYKIGIFGSAADNPKEVLNKAQELGEELAKHDPILITGLADGIPYKVGLTAAKLGSEVWGFAPASNLEEEKKIAGKQDLGIYKKIFYVPQDYSFVNNIQVCRKYRNVSSTATCVAGIIISGRWGTMNEFTNLYDMGKVIGVLTETGGIADELPRLMRKITKKSRAKVIFNKSPAKLIQLILNELKKKNKISV
ncbi:hypothetical protein A2954_06845 [Candidatus Roizmanbacteria bacterium RIFCSPLOWO2_01_FULL_37_12]|uniref:Uncharacterized protein n=1 Tax=Candidatus Roizmanbacteria bacterium RIFCSPLOWO2_01_FULL_37_12 TaxID=1802056 RepID=A0A1F7ID85_9BACT|nr:MAG: hypothetical protein A3D76_03095 [Candidatus Roizmanbacteria bacterium RIFCSPHIGHO2_02_FULL_37_9b]OGK41308.1 MAG: hypothetical protein A2954_06845 [Candidatus Roizmanbacteria bacterium RIFCSPLOWO2_01_FULL_37_12]